MRMLTKLYMLYEISMEIIIMKSMMVNSAPDSYFSLSLSLIHIHTLLLSSQVV